MASQQTKLLIVISAIIFYTIKDSNAAITPTDETYTRAIGSDVSIPWTYDNAADFDTVEWSYKSSSSPTPTLILDKVGAAAATVYNSFNVEHVRDGSITLKAVTSDNVGIYYCTVAYLFGTGHATITGTVTLSLTTAPTVAPTTDETSDTDAIVGGTVGGVLGFGGLVAVAVVGIRHLNKKKKGRTTTLTFVEGSKVTFSCPFPESVTFPEWRGPPGLTIYTILDDTSETINSKIPAFNRLQYARNKRDLILSNAVVGDSGDYKCSYTGQGDHTFTLKVIRGKGDQASNVVNAGSHRPGRPQPPPPSGANSNHREGSGSVVSGRDVEMQETETSFKRRQLPDIHDKKGRGLSANYNDDDHPLVSINIPTKKPGALESIPDSDRQEVTKKKKKRKKRVETEDNQSD